MDQRLHRHTDGRLTPGYGGQRTAMAVYEEVAIHSRNFRQRAELLVEQVADGMRTIDERCGVRNLFTVVLRQALSGIPHQALEFGNGVAGGQKPNDMRQKRDVGARE